MGISLAALVSTGPLRQQGILDQNTGEVNLNFESDFYFTAGPLPYQPPG